MGETRSRHMCTGLREARSHDLAVGSPIGRSGDYEQCLIEFASTTLCVFDISRMLRLPGTRSCLAVLFVCSLLLSQPSGGEGTGLGLGLHGAWRALKQQYKTHTITVSCGV